MEKIFLKIKKYLMLAGAPIQFLKILMLILLILKFKKK